MKQNFTSREDFEAYIARTGQDDDTYPNIYLGHTTMDFSSAYDISYTDYMTDKAYMLTRYDEYVEWIMYIERFDKTFEQFLDEYCSAGTFYRNLYADWARQEAYASEHNLFIYEWNEVLKMVQLAGTLKTAELYMRSRA